MYKQIEGNLITLAQSGFFDVIVHGCNCFCTMGAGIAPQMAKAFGCDDFPLEKQTEKNYYDSVMEEWIDTPTNNKGDINKLGQIDYKKLAVNPSTKHVYSAWSLPMPEYLKELIVINAYTQFYYGNKYGPPLDYDALTICLKKINYKFKGKHIGLPYVIGCGLAGGNPSIVLDMIKKELSDMEVTMVKFV